MRRPLPLPWPVVIGALARGDKDTDAASTGTIADESGAVLTRISSGPARVTPVGEDVTSLDNTLLSAGAMDDRLASASVGDAARLRHNAACQ